jgi:hypothetical protein
MYGPRVFPMLISAVVASMRWFPLCSIELATASGVAEALVMLCNDAPAGSLVFLLCLRLLVAFGYPMTEDVRTLCFQLQIATKYSPLCVLRMPLACPTVVSCK